MDNKLLMSQEAIKILMKFYVRTPMLPYAKKNVRSTLSNLYCMKQCRKKKVKEVYELDQFIHCETTGSLRRQSQFSYNVKNRLIVVF